jgi:hypothetical protein
MTLAARLASFAVAAALSLVACGGSTSSSGGLTCAWLGGSSNCWRSTAAAASGCLPSSADKGKLSADLKTCTYATGQVVTFNPPLTLPLPQDPTFDFTITSGGKACFSFQQPSQTSFSQTTSAGSSSVNASTGSEVVSCPDGSSVSASEQQAIQDISCDGGIFGGLPGTEWTSSATSVSFTLLGAGMGGGMPILTCAM